MLKTNYRDFSSYNTNHPHYFESQGFQNKVQLTDYSFDQIHNDILVKYYKYNSIIPFLELCWDCLLNLNWYMNTQELIIVSSLTIFISFYVIQEYMAVPVQIKGAAIPDTSTGFKSALESTPPRIEQDSGQESKPSLLLHRNRKMSHRHKKYLPEDHYFIHFKKFTYTVEDSNASEIDMKPTRSRQQPNDSASYMGLACFFIGCLMFECA